MTATAGVAHNRIPTPLGSINSVPQLALSQGYDAGNATGKYALYLQLLSGELFKAYQTACLANNAAAMERAQPQAETASVNLVGQAGYVMGSAVQAGAYSIASFFPLPNSFVC